MDGSLFPEIIRFGALGGTNPHTAAACGQVWLCTR
jgi:hypothetical protein